MKIENIRISKLFIVGKIFILLSGVITGFIFNNLMLSILVSIWGVLFFISLEIFNQIIQQKDLEEEE